MYNILITDTFKFELKDILKYISINYSKQSAIEYNAIVNKTLDLISNFPYSGHIPTHTTLRRLNIRCLTCKNNIIFYNVFENEHKIIIRNIISAKQDYINLIK